MIKLSVNLGFIWNSIPFLSALDKAKKFNFKYVETHWPYTSSAVEVKNKLTENNLQMLSINTRKGDLEGDFGLNAIKGREKEAQEYIDESINFASITNTKFVHLMAGKGESFEENKKTFINNINYALSNSDENLSFLLEPINTFDAPGYLLNNLYQAMKIINEFDNPRLKIMFDCYHIQKTHGFLSENFSRNLNQIGHVQIAAVPNRNEPLFGEINYKYIMSFLENINYKGAVGLEYLTKDDFDKSIMKTLDYFQGYINVKSH
jgi:hydroxypyruvate isomerase